MYRALRPELRAAQRVLRFTQSPRPSHLNRAVRIRTFTSFVRLQEKPSAPATPPQAPAGESWIKNITSVFKVDSQTSQANDTKRHLSDRRIERDAHDAVEAGSYLRKGLLPPGYKVADSAADLPENYESFNGLDSNATSFPALYKEDGSSFLPNSVLPKESNLFELQRSEETITADKSTERPLSMPDRRRLSRSQGPPNKRRRRSRDAFSVVDFEEGTAEEQTLPSWFINNNILKSRPQPNPKSSVIPVRSGKDGTYIPINAESADVQTQLPPQEAMEKPSMDLREHAYGTGGNGSAAVGAPSGGSGPRPDGNSEGKAPTSLTAGRYFVEAAQYAELSNTFKGRLRGRSSQVTPSSTNNALDIGHLTVLHGAKDADRLLDVLVTDLCNEAGVNRVRLDAQDISELIAAAELDPSIEQRGGRLSFKVYKDIYGPSNLYQENSMPRDDEDEDDDDDEDGDAPGRSFDIPIGSVVAFPTGSKPGNAFSKMMQGLPSLSKLLSGKGGGQSMSNMPFMKPSRGAIADDGSMDVFTRAIIDPILSTSFEHQIKQEPSVDSPIEAASGKSAPPKPLIIHVPTYKALQSQPLGEKFLQELLMAADKRTKDGQPIMIVGTDCMRDFSATQYSHAILEEQHQMSYGVSTAVVLTPVFPDRDAELLLLRDRQDKIRDINVRHLFQILKSRGVQLKGLDDGFWANEYTAQLGEADSKALSEGFWSFFLMQRVAAMIAGNQLSQTPVADARTAIMESDDSKVAWAQRNQPDMVKEEQKEADEPEAKHLRKVRSKATRHEKKLLSGVIEPKKIATTFNDIHIPTESVEALQMLTTLSLVRPEAFKYGVLKSDKIPGLLLYGPPGTGKTLAAKAVAKESGATMLEVSAADLNDMYVGEGEKNVQALFSLAKKLSPCVVFLDEADAMFSARSASGRRVSHRELLNQFLKEWDGMSNDSGSAFIMVATNRPMDLDDAVLRRLPRRLLIDLPTEQDRLEILKIHLRSEALAEDINLMDLAKKTPFYSGSDLKNVAVAAAMNAVREENEAAKKYRTDNPATETPYEYPERRTLVQTHFDKALEEISASISQDMSSLREIKKFDEQYGDRKGRKRKAPRWGFKSAAEADKVLDTVKVRS